MYNVRGMLLKSQQLKNLKMQELRQQFNEIDQQIIDLIAQRCELSAKIGQYKKAHNKEIVDQSRENEIIQSLVNLAKKKNLNSLFITHLYQIILEESKAIQKKAIEPTDK